MPEFAYKAVRRDGSRTEGSVTAKDRGEVLRHLAAKGMQPFQVHAADSPAPSPAKSKKTATPTKAGKKKDTSKRWGRIRLRPAQVIMFTEELSDLLNAGVQLEPALKLMAGRGELSAVGDVAEQAREKVRDGMSLAKALQAVSPSFGELYCNLVAAGEVSGALPAILQRQVHYLTTLQELKGKVVTAMIYPAFLLVAGVAVTVLFATFLIPRLTTLMQSSGDGDLPAGVTLIIGATEFLKAYWWVILLAIAAGIMAFRAYVTAPRNRLWWDEAQMKIPLYGPLQKSRFLVQFLQTLGNLLGNGLIMMNALELAEGSTRNLYFKQQLKKVTEEVAEGGSLARALDKSDIFPQALLDMVRIGEETGQMTEAINKTGERFDRELGRNIERVSAMIQPAIILMMAGVIGVMAYMMITVIYDTIALMRDR